MKIKLFKVTYIGDVHGHKYPHLTCSVITKTKDQAESIANDFNIIEDYCSEAESPEAHVKEVRISMKKLEMIINKIKNDGDNNPWGEDITYKSERYILDADVEDALEVEFE